ncbi:MAG: CoA ester lyase [Acetobacteraceae bacterium]|nr:CoA ester lyase [Acetobacteraceae bacterium]MSP29413.1 CoA ester lyase [Acetobacteraceae bacterium]
MRLRSPLFAPGDSDRKATKAIASAADCVILDLEDSVAASAKDAARAMTAGIVRANPGRDLIVRVNPRSTQWYLADLAAIVPTAPQALMLPKCTGPEDLVALDHHLEALEVASGLAVGGIKVVCLPTETAASVFNLGRYAGAPRLLAMCFGAEDISADLGVTPRKPDGSYPDAIAWTRGATLAAAGAAGVLALDTPFPDPRDPVGMARETAAAVADGFAGKLLIHPDQIDITNTAFTPDAGRITWAKQVRAAFAANPNAGVLSMDGKMLDRPHLRLAERILAMAG